MKSRAHVRSHPLHPILVVFPIAFFSGAFFTDLWAVISGSGPGIFGGYLTLAGIGGAVVAAIPGAIDYFGTVPPESSARKRASLHALLNVGMLFLFIVCYVLRPSVAGWIIVAIETVAFIMMCVAGWHGGTLVHRNQIGVDVRYAGAGKWKELWSENKDNAVVEAKLDVDQMALLHAGKQRIVIARTEDGYVAFDDRCTHRGGSLAGGSMICGTVQCPWHGSQFDVRTGALKSGPAKAAIRTYPVLQDGDRLTVRLKG